MLLLSFLASIQFSCILAVVYTEKSLLKVGCYDIKDVTEFTNLSIQKSASGCVLHCRSNFKRFAGIQNGSSCRCGEYYSGVDVNSCDMPCLENKEETCGGSLYVSVYETAGGALGAPRDLYVVNNTENSIHIAWKPPSINLANVLKYKVAADPIFYFNEQIQPPIKNFIFSQLTQTAYLDGLYSGAKYNISVIAVSDMGDGYSAFTEGWTKVGKPDVPKAPILLSRTPTTMMMQLEEALPTGGPISAYKIIVVDESLPIVIDFDSLDSFQVASDNGLPYYIAAEIKPENFETIFSVGDGKIYGKYFNAPLRKDVDYHILLGTSSTINETKTSYSESSHSQHESSHMTHDHDIKSEDSEENKLLNAASFDSTNGMILGLSVAVGLVAFLLISSVIIYLALRVYFKRNTRRCTDHQELAIHAHIPQDYENGYAVGAHYLDDEEPSPDHYRLLREKVIVYPYQNMNIVAELGVGKFGDVEKGIARINGSEQANTLVHRIHDNNLSPARKSEMLKEFDMHIKIGKHSNIVALLGLTEELNIISIVFEYETLPFKSNLLESRAVQHYPVYAEKNRRFSTLQEKQVLEVLVGIARGMNHLSSLNISHGNLCARNIALRDGIHPKISGFGLIHYHNDVYIPDYCRWQSPEALRSKVNTCLADIWSFGCLMWEAVTLGGTPYADIRTDEILNRITRGLRLAQPQYTSDEFYQSMLLCWQNDPDERPSFSELESLLQRLAEDDITPHLLFSLYPSFKYELYSQHLEFID